jgi:hypothetical protein
MRCHCHRSMKILDEALEAVTLERPHVSTGLVAPGFQAMDARSSMSCQESIRRAARCCRCPGRITDFPRPFTCEFCDIIVITFGRRPRLKKSEQVLAELEAFRRAALRSCLWLTTISSATRTRRFARTQFTGADGEVQRNIQTVSLAVKALPRARRSAAARIHTPERGFARR